MLHDLTDLLPGRIHLTVPPTFRKRAPRGVVLHKAVLSEKDIEERSGFRTTTALRTLVDSAQGGVSQEQLENAVRDALARGLVRRAVLAEASRTNPRLSRLRAVISENETAATRSPSARN